MENTRRYSGIDYFKIIAALMVIAIHTCGWNGPVDILMAGTLFRIAAPFFLVIAGYFVLGPWREEGCTASIIGRYWMRIFALSLVASAIYLPINIYAGGFSGSTDHILQMVFFDGFFYHLWYFPALLIGYPLAAILIKKLGLPVAGCVALLLYIVGLLGDSWYGLVGMVEPVKEMYDYLYQYLYDSANGVFYAPVFLVLGAWLADRKRQPSTSVLSIGLAVSVALLLVEGWYTWSQGLQHSNTMYLSLLPVQVCLLPLLMKIPHEPPQLLRPMSQWMFILHPLVILLIQTIAIAIGLTQINTILYFLLVTTLSAAVSWLVIQWLLWRQKQRAIKAQKAAEEEAETM